MLGKFSNVENTIDNINEPSRYTYPCIHGFTYLEQSRRKIKKQTAKQWISYYHVNSFYMYGVYLCISGMDKLWQVGLCGARVYWYMSSLNHIIFWFPVYCRYIYIYTYIIFFLLYVKLLYNIIIIYFVPHRLLRPPGIRR